MTRFALERRVVTGMALAVLMVAGIGSYLTLPQAEDPGFVVRTALVTTIFPGASPDRVERLVTNTLEEAIEEIPELDFVKSESKTGVSVQFVNIQERYRDMRPIWDNLRRRVERAAERLPDGVIGPTVNDEFGDVFGIVIALTGDGFSDRELSDAATLARDELLRAPDAAKVEIHGAQDERIYVEYNNARLAELGVSPLQLRSILAASNIIISGGHITIGPERLALEPTGNFETLEDLRQTVISLPGRDELVYLGDLATVTRGYVDPPQSLARANGARSLALAVALREGGNIATLGVQVRGILDRLSSQLPVGIQLEPILFQPDAVSRKVDDFVVNLLQSVAIVALVMLVTLGLRTGLIVASLIPAAMVLALFLMPYFGMGLDQMSLASLIIALGMLVDNAIVMSESISVQMATGRSAVNAALDSADELRIPLLTSSLTTAAAFLPIYLAESTTGEYTAPLFVVVTITLLCSWVLALTMIPLLAVLFLKPPSAATDAEFDGVMYRVYRAGLAWLLRHRVVTVLATVVLLIGSVWLLGRLPTVFFPASDKATLTAELTLPTGTRIERTAQVVADVERFLADELQANGDRPDGVTTWAAFVGRGAPKFELPYNPKPSSPEYAILIVNATSRDTVDDVVARLTAYCRDRLPDVDATIKPLTLGPPVEAPVQVRVSGNDLDDLFKRVEAVKQQLQSIDGTRNVVDDWGARTKKVVVDIDQPRARLAGVTNQDVAVSLQALLSGLETTQFREEDDLIPVTLRLVAADREDVDRLETLDVYSQATGRSVPLGQVARLRPEWQPARILRRGGVRTVTVEADTAPGVTAADVIERIAPWLERESQSWGLGASYALGGEIESSGKSQASIVAKLPVAALIIVLLLVGQFNSLRKPLIILLTIPLALIGVAFGLFVTGQSIGFMPFLGIIALAGIVINNAIVLIERIQLEIDVNRRTPAAAIVEAAQRRLRPILLTTATTLGGLLPLWFGGGPLWEAMAIAIIFGLLFATVLTLGIVPVLYAIFFRVDVRQTEASTA
ncbi:MAG: efflux RND transporter permease subunit [Vicinamibacterales bacterium]